MGKKRKLERFAENETFHNMFQLGYEQLKSTDFFLKGRWKQDFFSNSNPLVVELGCGKGEYTVGMARAMKHKNFIGIDIKGARMWKGCKASQEENLNNAAFIRTKIELIPFFFGQNEIDEIWITFPDPQPRKSKGKKRLTSPQFLERYKLVAGKECIVHLKTDSDLLYNYTLEVIQEKNLTIIENISDLYNSDAAGYIKEIQTYYERIWLDRELTIKYLCFKLFSENG